MLILGRRPGESIHVGDDVIRVNNVHGDTVMLTVSRMGLEPEHVNVRLEDGHTISDVSSFRVLRVQNKQVRIGITAPSDMKILRDELLP